MRFESKTAALPPEEVKRVKALGFFWDKNTPDRFNGRVITRCGKVSADELAAIAEAARRFGSGEVAATTRLTLEVQGVPFEDIQPMRDFLGKAGLETGGAGAQVRPIACCKGTTCQYGLIDVYGLAQEMQRLFFWGEDGAKLPHKFKIAVGGCPNNCLKPDLNDLGVVGQRVPLLDLDKCRGCKVCQVQKNCPMQAPRLENGKVSIDDSQCSRCGRCLGKCPFHAVEAYTSGYRVYIGGRWGKKVARGRPLGRLFLQEGQVLEVTRRALCLFRGQGRPGERFSDTIVRLGFEEVEGRLLEGLGPA